MVCIRATACSWCECSYWVDRVAIGCFGPTAAGQKCRPEATIDLLQRLLEIPVSAYGKL